MPEVGGENHSPRGHPWLNVLVREQRAAHAAPWYVGISADGSTLDNQECDNYAMVTHAHMTQTATRVTASGKANHYGKIPYKFAPSAVMISPSPVGQALVGQRPWTDPTVIRAARVLLDLNREAARDTVSRGNSIHYLWLLFPPFPSTDFSEYTAEKNRFLRKELALDSTVEIVTADQARLNPDKPAHTQTIV